MEDRWLVSRLRRGNAQALCRIYEKYRDDLLRLAVSLANDTAAAEDIVHDVFVSFLRQARQFRLTGSLKSYLATCVANRARKVNRAQHVPLKTALSRYRCGLLKLRSLLNGEVTECDR